jgi:hypothetical protein
MSAQIDQTVEILAEARSDFVHRRQPSLSRAFLLVGGAHYSSLFVIKKG